MANNIKILLDPGHYGNYNRSPAVRPYWESVMAWDLHLMLKSELEKYGFIVGVTRSSQTQDIEVYNRGKKAKGYDMFLSLHSNATGSERNDKVDYPIIYHLANDKTGADMAEGLTVKIAKIMNTKQEGRISARLQANGAEYYGVLRGAKSVGCPHAFIIEHSFHTAFAPTNWLLDKSNLKKLAVIEAEHIAEFYNMKKTEYKEEEEMTKEEIQKMIEEAIEAISEPVYHYFSELPDWAHDPIKALYDNNLFYGIAADDLDLSESLARTLVVIARDLKAQGRINW